MNLGRSLAHHKGLRQGSVGDTEHSEYPELNLKEVFARVVEMGRRGRRPGLAQGDLQADRSWDG